jgi:hypothetical protein
VHGYSMANLAPIRKMRLFLGDCSHMAVVQSEGTVSSMSCDLKLVGLHFGSVETLEIVHHGAATTDSQYAAKT